MEKPSLSRGYKQIFMLNSAEPEFFSAHKYKKYQEIQLISGSDKPTTCIYNVIFPAHKC